MYKRPDLFQRLIRKQHLPDDAPELPEKWKSIAISGLNFSHKETFFQGEKAQSLHDIHLQIEKGKRIALIGESGSGKSTLMALFRGLYDPQPGAAIKVDGVNTEIASIAESITLFPQEPEIFENTIEHNITLGLPFEEKEILEVCDTAHFTEVFRHLPKGLQSNIHGKGRKLIRRSKTKTGTGPRYTGCQEQ